MSLRSTSETTSFGDASLASLQDDLLQHLDVQLHAFVDFGEVHKLVGGVRTGAVAGTELERWRIDQRLIGGGWRSIGGAPQRQACLYDGVRNINLRWA